jgi:ribosomal protein S3
MKTAVELLEDAINEVLSHLPLEREEIKMLIEKAKEMEKQQSINFAYEIADDLAHGVYFKKAIENLFNETFKSE